LGYFIYLTFYSLQQWLLVSKNKVKLDRGQVCGTRQGSDCRCKKGYYFYTECAYMEEIFIQKARILCKIFNLGPGDDISAGDELVQEGAPQLLVLHEVLLPRQNLRRSPLSGMDRATE
jgi:hypothetical protein